MIRSMGKARENPRNRLTELESVARALRHRWVNARRLLAPRGADSDRPAPLEAFFGPLELEVIECLWDGPAEATVREIQRDFPGTAYTTLMTTLDRLYKKGVLDRCKHGRAYLYSARFTRSGLQAYLARDAFEALLDGGRTRASLRPLLSSFVEAVSRRDAELLDDLEKLVRDRRNAQAGDADRTGNGRR